MLVLTLVPALVAGAAVDDTTIVSVATRRQLADGASGPGVVVSPSGRYVVFESDGGQPERRRRRLGREHLPARSRDRRRRSWSAARPARQGREPTPTRRTPRSRPAGACRGVRIARHEPQRRRRRHRSRTCSCGTSDGHHHARQPRARTARRRTATPGTRRSRRTARGRVRVACDQPERADDDAVQRRVHLRLRRPARTTLVSRQPPAQDPAATGRRSIRTIFDRDGRRFAFASEADNLFAGRSDRFTNVYVSTEPAFMLLKHVCRTSTTGFVDRPGGRRLLRAR